jgi:c-di-GMP-binding flagellar brake protein YcgR
LKNIRTIGVEIQNGSSFKTVITDLSAGGFSCTASKGFKLSMDKPLDVNFVLPLMDENAPISTKAVYIGRKEKGSGHFQTGRFEFVDDISEQERDTIHGYILKEQFELMNAKML